MRADRFYHSPDRLRNDVTPFSLDRDRILYSYFFRRLGNVTQVVSPSEGHQFYNRLTHSLRVAGITREIARTLQSKNDHETIEALGGLDVNVVEAAALAHDLGHPPFGHIAEGELDTLVREFGGDVAEGYEGNAQTFRIVTKLEIWRSEVLGLNLTRATLNALLKYPWLRTISQDFPKRGKKWGSYLTEKVVFNWARELFANDSRKSLEAEIMDVADDIAYALDDVEDFYFAGIIPFDHLIANDLERQRFLEGVFENIKWDSVEFTRDEFADIFTELMFLLPFGDRYQGSRSQKGIFGLVRSVLQQRYIEYVSLNSDAVSLLDQPRIKFPHQLRIELEIFKWITRYYVIRNRALKTQQHGQVEIIRDLFKYYFEASEAKRDPQILPEDFPDNLNQEIQINSHLNEKILRARLVADAISRMTDFEAIKVHTRLTGRNTGSILDRIP